MPLSNIKVRITKPLNQGEMPENTIFEKRSPSAVSGALVNAFNTVDAVCVLRKKVTHDENCNSIFGDHVGSLHS